MCVCLCIYIYAGVHLCVNTVTGVCMFICMCVSAHDTFIHISKHLAICVCIYKYVYMCIYIFECVCMHSYLGASKDKLEKLDSSSV